MDWKNKLKQKDSRNLKKIDSRALTRSQLSLYEESDDTSETYTEVISDKEVATFKVTDTKIIVEKVHFLAKTSLKDQYFFKTLGMNGTKEWSQEHNEIEARKNFSSFDSHNKFFQSIFTRCQNLHTNRAQILPSFEVP